MLGLFLFDNYDFTNYISSQSSIFFRLMKKLLSVCALALVSAGLLSACSGDYEHSTAATEAMKPQLGKLAGISEVAVCQPDSDGDVDFTVHFSDDVYGQYSLLTGPNVTPFKERWVTPGREVNVATCFNSYALAPYLISFLGSAGFNVDVRTDFAKNTRFADAASVLQRVSLALPAVAAAHSSYVEPQKTWNP
ncbi:hypothetical protein AB4Y45_32240 [Paraburkholderia sp. EG287A]|uniref:hypothetical protein n=1 Tax=Paraburkholderia sp. EG287A TaxID=3237012 RepID=UPI0034D2E54E